MRPFKKKEEIVKTLPAPGYDVTRIVANQYPMNTKSLRSVNTFTRDAPNIRDINVHAQDPKTGRTPFMKFVMDGDFTNIKKYSYYDSVRGEKTKEIINKVDVNGDTALSLAFRQLLNVKMKDIYRVNIYTKIIEFLVIHGAVFNYRNFEDYIKKNTHAIVDRGNIPYYIAACDSVLLARLITEGEVKVIPTYEDPNSNNEYKNLYYFSYKIVDSNTTENSNIITVKFLTSNSNTLWDSAGEPLSYEDAQNAYNEAYKPKEGEVFSLEDLKGGAEAFRACKILHFLEEKGVKINNQDGGKRKTRKQKRHSKKISKSRKH